MKRSTGFVERRSLLNQQQGENLKPVMDELSPMLNADFRSIDRAAIAGKTKIQITNYKAQRSKGSVQSQMSQDTNE